MRGANLICIGSQKAATTWLHRMLARHPQTFMPAMKEVHYFDTLHVKHQKTFQIRRSGRARRLLHEQFGQSAVHRAAAYFLTDVIRHRNARRYIEELRFTAALWGKTVDDAWYASLFEAARLDQVTCDFTCAYALLPPEGIAHVHRLCPDARVLMILRDPVERAISHARMLVVRHGAPRTSESVKALLESNAVRSHDDTVAALDRWQEHWPRERFKVLFYDDVKRQPLNVLEEVCRFAGLPFEPGYFPRPDRVVYRGPSVPVSDDIVLSLRERFQPLLAELARRYPMQAGKWGKREAIPIALRSAPRAVGDQKTSPT